MSTIDNTQLKNSIASRFGNSVTEYEKKATIQRDIARRLIDSLKPWKASIPAGPILEVGCGTGFVTEGLIELYPERQLEITDLTPEMVDFCSSKFSDSEQIDFYTLDAEMLQRQGPGYALTISGFAAQWFKDPALTLGAMLERTKPGGLMLVSFPGNESFPEWKKYCQELGLPFTGNNLPDTEEIAVKLSVGPSQIDFYEDTVTQQFESAADFFRHLKEIGASAPTKERSLKTKELKMLINHWDQQSSGPVAVSYHVVFMAVKRDYNS